MDTTSDNKSEAEEKIDFFLVSAHELRTSLSAMKWLFKMLLDGDFGPLNETQSAMIAQATGANERMILLLNDTMTIVRNDGASIPYLTLPVSLSKLTEESIKEFTSEAANKGMHIRYDPAPSPVMVIGDEEKLRIVLHNLLENAIKYGSNNTDISVSLKVADGNVVFTIVDHGITIPTAEQSHIFQKFFRSSNAKNAYIGVGLGLYATKHIVERHGGTIAFMSKDNIGTVFTLTLPLG
jgi:signal transduction histidine kinase